MTGTRQRGRGRPKSTRWVALAAVLLVILGLTFALGVFVGRQRARQTDPAVAAEPARKPSLTSRRGGLTGARAERPPQPQEKLTFYQTLTAPLGPVRMPEGADAGAKPSKAPATPAKPPERASEATRGGSSALGTGERQEATAEWTVQVGVFSSAEQAAGVKKQLAEGGFEAQVTPTTTGDGQVRYRVRLGAFRTKDEAVRTAERVRSDRSLPTYVTTR